MYCTCMYASPPHTRSLTYHPNHTHMHTSPPPPHTHTHTLQGGGAGNRKRRSIVRTSSAITRTREARELLEHSAGRRRERRASFPIAAREEEEDMIENDYRCSRTYVHVCACTCTLRYVYVQYVFLPSRKVF